MMTKSACITSSTTIVVFKLPVVGNHSIQLNKYQQLYNLNDIGDIHQIMMRRCDKSLQNLILSKKKIIHEKVKCMTFFMELKCIFSKRQFLQFSLCALALFDVEPITLDDFYIICRGREILKPDNIILNKNKMNFSYP